MSSSNTLSRLPESEIPGWRNGKTSARRSPQTPGVAAFLPGQHPRSVGLDGVDLPVVGEGAERLGVVPRREGIGRIPLVEDGERRLEIGIAQVPVEVRDLGGGEQPFVDHGAARGRRDGQSRDIRPLDALPGQIEGALEIGAFAFAGDDGLLDEGQDESGVIAEDRGISGDRAPEQEMHPLRLDGLSDHRSGGCGIGRREEAHHHSETLRRHFEPVGGQLAVDQSMGHLGQEPGAVTGAVCRPSPTVVQVDQALDGETCHPEGGREIPGGDEPDAAGVTVRARIEEGCRHHSLGVSGAMKCKPGNPRSNQVSLASPNEIRSIRATGLASRSGRDRQE